MDSRKLPMKIGRLVRDGDGEPSCTARTGPAPDTGAARAADGRVATVGRAAIPAHAAAAGWHDDDDIWHGDRRVAVQYDVVPTQWPRPAPAATSGTPAAARKMVVGGLHAVAAGRRLCVWTREGRVAMVILDQAPSQRSAGLAFHYVVWQPGS